MNILIKNARVIDSKSQYNNQTVDLFIENGKITQIEESIPKKAEEIIEHANLHISPGWIDIGAMCWEPGLEHREDIASLKAAAANGGYTRVFIWPNTTPPIDNKAQYEYFLNQNKSSAVDLLPICSVTKKSEGKELAEILDLHNSGAKIFSDGLIYKGNKSELYKALEYIKPTSAKLLYAPNPFKIFPDGQIHESKTSILLGLQGLPELSEKMDLEALVQLAEYADCQCIVHNVSSAAALKICGNDHVAAVGVGYLNLCKNVESCKGFETNYKVIPPLRSSSDSKALNKAVQTDKMDYISSNHYPVENDLKDREFGMAHFGASGIETVFAALRTDTTMDISKIIEKLTYGPASAAGIEMATITENAEANITLFDPDIEWTYNDSNRKSKCINNPYYNALLKGKAIGVFNSSKIVNHLPFKQSPP